MLDSNSAAAAAAEKTAEPAQIDGRGGLLAFVTDQESEAALRAGLIGVAADVDIRSGTLRQAIRFVEKETPPPALVVDIEGVTDPQSALDDLARVCPPDVKVVVIGDNKDIGFYRMLVNELGVAEYVHKPLTRDNVQRLVLPRLTGSLRLHAGLRGGHVAAVCSAGGGMGATTVAVNLAVELAAVTNSHVALLDLNLHGGTAAAMVGARPGPGLRMALEDAERADALFLDRTAITVTPRLRLIAAEEGFETTLAITEAGVARVLEVLRQKFNFVIIDLPMPLPPAMRKAIAVARTVAVVLGPEVAALRDAKAIRQMVTVTTGTDRVLTVLNRADLKGGLPPALIQQGLGGRLDATIPDLGKRMLEAVNLGTPALERVPSLRRHLSPLVREIAGIRTGSPRSSLWGRILGR